MKEAMKAKDTNRLNVVRAILAEVSNSAKSQKPIQTNLQLLSLLRKRAADYSATAESYKAANRSDLVEKEEAQVKVLQEYGSMVETMSPEDVKSAVGEAIKTIKDAGETLNMGVVLKKLVGEGGSLAEKADKGEVARAVKEALAS
jgi:uncharacterized protein